MTVDVINAIAVSQQDGIAIGRVNFIDDDTITFIPATGLPLDYWALVPGVTYTIRKNQSTEALKDSGFYLTLNSDGSINYEKSTNEWYELNAEGISRVLGGAIENVAYDVNHKVLSAKMHVADSSELSIFNEFDVMTFDADHTAYTYANNRIAFDAVTGTWTFYKNLSILSATKLVDQNDIIQAKIYLDDAIYDVETDELNSVTVTYKNERITLDSDNHFASRVESDNFNTLCCSVDNGTTKFDIYAPSYKYTAINSVPTVPTSVLIKPSVNHFLDDNGLTSALSIVFIEPTLSELDDPVIVNYNSGTGIWSNEFIRGNLTFNVSVDINTNKVIVNCDGPEDSDETLIGTSTYTIDLTPVLDTNEHIIDFKPVVSPFIVDIHEETQREKFAVQCGILHTAQTFSYTFTVDTSRAEKTQFIIPNRTSANISREAIYALTFMSSEDKLIDIEFISEDFYTTYLHTKVPTNKVSYLHVREIAADVFIVTDLAENREEWKFDWLKNQLLALSGDVNVVSTDLRLQIESNDNDINYISSDLSTLEHRHYNTTFISTDRADQPAHISSDNLILTDTLARNLNDDIHNRYHLTFKYGTMVLVKDN